MAFLKLDAIGRTYRHLQRYRQILSILLKFGFDDLVSRLQVERYLEIALPKGKAKAAKELREKSAPERLRLVLEELGSTFIKIGQILSTRPDLLPPPYIEELRRLQSEVPPEDFEVVEKTLEEALKRPIHEVFSEFKRTPLAAASIAQIHEAQLLNGPEVVVKVQRAKLAEKIEADLEILHHLASLMENHVEGWEVQKPTVMVREIAKSLEKEIDFGMEAAHIERFAYQFKDDETVHVPKVYRHATSTKVLTMEMIHGVKASDFDRLRERGHNLKRIAERCAQSGMEQIFTHGFFHADPHPGNLFVLREDVICFVDFGMMGLLDRDSRLHFADLLYGIASRDEGRAAQALLKLTIWDRPPDRKALERDLTELMTRHFYRPIKDMELGKLLHQLMQQTTLHRLRLSPQLFMVIKALSTIESLVRSFYPDFDFIKEAAPYVRQVRMERFNPAKLASGFMETGTEALDLLRDAPEKVHKILDKVERGEAQIGFEHKGLKPFMFTFERISNRISFALVLSALIIGSSLIVHAGVPPLWHDIPIIGVVGYVVAAIMGFSLLLSILKHGKM